MKLSWIIIGSVCLSIGCTGPKSTSPEGEIDSTGVQTDDVNIPRTYTDDQQMITLASIIYDETIDEIDAELSNSQLATGGHWKRVWGPVDISTTRVFVAQDMTISSGKYAVVVRGTIDSLVSWFYDFDALKQVPLPWISGAQQKLIGAGLAEAWGNISQMTSDTQPLMGYLNTIPNGSEVFVTGHSQGGGLATVVALWLNTMLEPKQVIVKPVTWAGQTAGNSSFAELYNQTFKSNSSEALDKRYYNTRDIVPKGFADLMSIKDLYDVPGPYCPDDIKLLLDGVQGSLDLFEDRYTQVGTPMPLDFRSIPAHGSANGAFMAEVGVQHSHFTYQYLMGVPYTAGVPEVYPPQSVGSGQ